MALEAEVERVVEALWVELDDLVRVRAKVRVRVSVRVRVRVAVRVAVGVRVRSELDGLGTEAHPRL